SVTGLSTTPGAPVTLYAVWNRVRTAADTVAPIISLDFDADTGATASDSSGNGYNATWSGTSSYSSGVSGKAAYVNAPAGSSGPVNFLSLPMLTGLTDGSSSFSYEFWMKEVSATVDAEVVSNQDFAHCYNKGASFYNTSGSAGILRGCYGQNGSSTTQHYLANATPSSIVGAWHHLAVVVDRSAGTMTTYADGVQTVKDTNLTSAFSLISGYPFRIGSDGTGTNTSDGYLNAYIDDFDFFAAAVPASQISADYLATKPATGVAYTVAFDANGATSGSMSPEAMVSDTAKALTANAFTRTGYGFGGWATSPGGPVAYADRQSVTGLSTTPGATVP
ncbi:LamG-like jellyroll fold domain-containing protein, partial [Mesorhizobium japonicum]|uniref:LamG-like jellyroll fold domain-containing protein n=1 Tax=Mesorhizobium japonicum TaxID=2066070 RepID=UPI003B5C1A9B